MSVVELSDSQYRLSRVISCSVSPEVELLHLLECLICWSLQMNLGIEGIEGIVPTSHFSTASLSQ